MPGDSGQSPGSSKVSILIVEDEAIIAADLEKRLLRYGYEISGVVATAEAALRKVARQKPSLVLMDIVLRGDMDGIQAAADMRRLFNIPVIYLTAYADEKTVERAKHTEPFGYIIKPFDDRELRSSIEMALYRHAMERKVRESGEWLSTILRSIGDGVIASDENGLVTFMNPVAEEMTGWPQDNAKGLPVAEIMKISGARAAAFYADPVAGISAWGSASELSDDTVMLSKNGITRAIEVTGAPIISGQGEMAGVVMVIHDVSVQKKLDLALRESEQKLRLRALELEEGNTALKVLLRHRENDRKEVEGNVLANLKQLVMPYVEKLKNRAGPEDLIYLNILERNLEEIVSPFSFRLSSGYYGLTPREIAIADLIRDGKQDKEIMELLNISYETVKSHRQNLRKKLGIYSKRINLRTHLLSFDER